MMGIGGSPGESVYVKAGASTALPVVSDDDTGASVKRGLRDVLYRKCLQLRSGG